MKRVFFFLLLLFVIVFGNPIVGITAALLVGISVNYQIYEIILLGFIVDLLYASVYSYGFIQIPLYTFITVIIFFSLSSIKKRLNFYA